MSKKQRIKNKSEKKEEKKEVFFEKEKLPEAVEIPAVCPRCESARKKVYKSVRLENTPIKLPSGEYHTGLMLRYAECEDCRQRYKIRVPI